MTKAAREKIASRRARDARKDEARTTKIAAWMHRADYAERAEAFRLTALINEAVHRVGCR